MLQVHEMNATFYVNTKFIGDSTHMTYGELEQLFAAGNEIAGHTLDHVDIKKLKPAEGMFQVCEDRDNLIN